MEICFEKGENNFMAMEKHQDVVNLRTEHPNWSLAEIGRRTKKSRERIRQILTRKGLWLGRPKKIDRFCRVCNKSLKNYNVRRKFCSKECNHLSHLISLKCSYCGKIFFRLKNLYASYRKINTNLRFCCRYCQGKYAGKNWGFKNKIEK